MAYEIENSDTPIFDQLARERDYKRLITRLPIDLHPAWKIRGFMAPGAYIDEWSSVTVGQTDEAVNAAPTEEDELIVFHKPIPVTTLADLAKGQQQE